MLVAQLVPLALTLAGVVLAAGAHCSVSRHAPPPGWGYLYGAYEVAVPTALSAAIVWHEARVPLLVVSATVALLVGGASQWVAAHTREALTRQSDDARLSRALYRGSRWSVDLDGMIGELERRRSKVLHPHDEA